MKEAWASSPPDAVAAVETEAEMKTQSMLMVIACAVLDGGVWVG